MIRLVIPTGNQFVDLPGGVRLELRPIDSGLQAAADAEAARRVGVLQSEADAAAEAGQPLDKGGFNGANAGALNGMFWQFQTEALLRFALVSWTGLGDAKGDPLPVSPAACAAFAAVPSLAGGFREKYDETPRLQAAEGNGSAPTSAGVTAAAASTAPDASSDEASPGTPTVPSADPAPPS